MRELLLIGLASLSAHTTEFQVETSPTSTVTCTATATGPVFSWSSPLHYFFFDTTCDGTVETITIHATIIGPSSEKYGTKTCTNTDACSYVLGEYYERGTWTWTNDTVYTGGTTSATSTRTLNY